MPERRHPDSRTVYRSIGLSPRMHDWAALLGALGRKNQVAPVLVQCIQDGLLKILDEVSRDAHNYLPGEAAKAVEKYRAGVEAARIKPSPMQVDLWKLDNFHRQVLLEQIVAISGEPNGSLRSLNAAHPQAEHATE